MASLILSMSNAKILLPTLIILLPYFFITLPEVWFFCLFVFSWLGFFACFWIFLLLFFSIFLFTFMRENTQKNLNHFFHPE